MWLSMYFSSARTEKHLSWMRRTISPRANAKLTKKFMHIINGNTVDIQDKFMENVFIIEFLNNLNKIDPNLYSSPEMIINLKYQKDNSCIEIIYQANNSEFKLCLE